MHNALTDFEYNSRFLANSLKLAWIVIIYVILILLYVAVGRAFQTKLQCSCCTRSLAFLSKRYMFRIPIRIVLELTIELAFCLQIALAHFDMSDAQNWLEGFDMLLALVLSLLVFGTPLMILIFFCGSKERIAQMENKNDSEF